MTIPNIYFQLKEQIGKGAQATVYIAERQLDKQLCVLKKVRFLFYLQFQWHRESVDFLPPPPPAQIFNSHSLHNVQNSSIHSLFGTGGLECRVIV